MHANLLIIPVLHQLRGFFKGMAFPLLSAGVLNATLFGSYAKALDYLTQAQCSGDSQSKPASSAQVFAAGCFSGLAQVRTSEVCLID